MSALVVDLGVAFACTAMGILVGYRFGREDGHAHMRTACSAEIAGLLVDEVRSTKEPWAALAPGYTPKDARVASLRAAADAINRAQP